VFHTVINVECSFSFSYLSESERHSKFIKNHLNLFLEFSRYTVDKDKRAVYERLFTSVSGTSTLSHFISLLEPPSYKQSCPN